MSCFTLRFQCPPPTAPPQRLPKSSIHASLIRHGHEDHPIPSFKLQRCYSISMNERLFIGSDADTGCRTKCVHALDCAEMLPAGTQRSSLFPSPEYGVFMRKVGNAVSAQHLFDRMPERSLVSLTAMITRYSKHGDLDGVRLLFSRTVDKDVVCWNVMIGVYIQHGRPRESLALFRQMLALKLKPNEVTLLVVHSDCGQLPWVHSYTVNHRIQLSTHIAVALVDMYSKYGSLEDTRLVFNSILHKDVVAGELIVGYVMHRLKSLQLFSDMCSRRIQPTDITFMEF